MSFDFATAARILFGEGRIAEAGAIAAELGAHALLVSSGSERSAVVVASLHEHGIATTRATGCELVVAVGGGSVIDAGKAIAALITNRAPVREYLEVVGRAQPLAERSVPYIAIPTTAGTGAEVTRNAVLMAEEERVKVSLRSPFMLPTVALVDPELTYSLPPDVTASTGLDALTQCLEPFVSSRANPITDALARDGIRRAAGALRRVVRDGRDVEARRDMSIASLCGGLALANAKLGAVHGFAAPLGGMFPIPHGVACARLLAPVAAANVRALRERTPASRSLARYQEVARMVTGRADALAEDGAEWLAALVEELGVPRLGAFGVRSSDVGRVVEQAKRASSMQGNPVALDEEELAEVLGAAL
ncbi:MAG: alcohol dehydrogenase [Gemmatimonadetes bacterium]|nr:MAG: alcohol dehydrogenase [Gemmatimonadota bacterium]